LEIGAAPRKPPAISSSGETGNSDQRGSPVAGFGPEDAGIYTETGRTEMNRYTVFFEPTATGYSAHVPDLPGCIAAGETLEETRQLIREAIEFHVEGMRLHGEDVPEPTKHIEQVEIPA
jgi:predicted RNase H-like HicB family nuclease